MTTLCARCALRLRRAAQTETRQPPHRAFSQTPTPRRHHGVPTFTPTPSPPLDTTLAALRTKHFIPASLHAPDRRLIFGTKNRQTLADNPQTVTIEREDIPLLWLDRRTEIPNRTKLVHAAIDAMVSSGEGWSNLPSLLAGLRRAGVKWTKGSRNEALLGKIVRKAVQAGKIGTVVLCLQQAETTGMRLGIETVLENVMWGLHTTAQREQWSEASVVKAMKASTQIALLLESEGHGGGREVRERDPRRRPEVVGTFLELAAVYAWKFQGGKDVDGKVRTYTERLLGCLEGALQPPSRAPLPTGPQYEMHHGIPIYHGLALAEKILAPTQSFPRVAGVDATKVRKDYEAGLTILAGAIEAGGVKAGSYGEGAVGAWRGLLGGEGA
ncbi:hypothetical protein LTR08_007309 [Meristemomyces frigidus]|nr:hypothetical protein LTR08_007309 [Meristemomyces frigidus]